MSNEHNNAHAQEQCNACCGTGRMVRDPDIGTDQECFVCDGAGFLPAQEVGLTDEERADMACAVAAICTGTSSRTVAATAIEWTERALRAKGGSHDA